MPRNFPAVALVVLLSIFGKYKVFLQNKSQINDSFCLIQASRVSYRCFRGKITFGKLITIEDNLSLDNQVKIDLR